MTLDDLITAGLGSVAWRPRGAGAPPTPCKEFTGSPVYAAREPRPVLAFELVPYRGACRVFVATLISQGD